MIKNEKKNGNFHEQKIKKFKKYSREKSKIMSFYSMFLFSFIFPLFC